MIYAPKYGLKGQLDASVRVRRHAAGAGGGEGGEELMPLEIKSGKEGSMGHRAQVVLYTLLLSERYPGDGNIDRGVLVYLQTGKTLGVPAKPMEVFDFSSTLDARISPPHCCTCETALHHAQLCTARPSVTNRLVPPVSRWLRCCTCGTAWLAISSAGNSPRWSESPRSVRGASQQARVRSTTALLTLTEAPPPTQLPTGLLSHVAQLHCY